MVGYVLLRLFVSFRGNGGIRGIQFAQPIADVCIFLLATAVIMEIIKELEKSEKKQGLSKL